MRFIGSLLSVTVLALALAVPGIAHAERGVYFDDYGYRCEINVQEDLFKVVCRNPRNFGDYYVCFGEIRADVVFRDCFSEQRAVVSTEEPTVDFLRRIRGG